MKCRWMMAAMLLALLVGCTQPVPEARKEANVRWNHTRAQILYGTAQQQHKTGQLDKARLKILESLSLDPEYTEARVMLGRIMIEQGDYELAVAELSKANADRPNSPETLFLLGVAQEKAGQLEDALVSYRRCHAVDGTHVDAILAATEVLVAQERVEEARSFIAGYLDSAGNEPGIYEMAGRLAMMEQQYAQAADYFTRALDLDYENHRYAESLGRAQYLAGRHSDAYETLNTLVRKENYKPRAWVWTLLGDCSLSRERFSDARDAYLAAAELDPQNTTCWVNLAKAALALGDARRAIIAAEHALSLDPSLLEASMILGCALLQDDQPEKALEVLTRTVSQHQGSADLHCLLGRAHAVAGNTEAAKRCYANAIRIQPDNPLARQLMSSIQ